VHYLAAAMAAQHLTDLLREAELERRASLVRGARRSPWSAFSGRLAAVLHRPAGPTPSDARSTPSTGTRPAAA